MRKLTKIVATAAAPLALAGVLGTAASASAAPQPGNGNSVVEVYSQLQLDRLAGPNQVITKNIDIPASATPIQLMWTTVQGNISIEGNVSMAADVVDGNVTVSGPGSFLSLFNGSSHILGNLTVTGSSGIYQGSSNNASFGDWTAWAAQTPTAASQVDGGLIFTNNSGSLWAKDMSGGLPLKNMGGGLPLHVHGKFVYSDNTTPYGGGLSVDGKQSISNPA